MEDGVRNGVNRHIPAAILLALLFWYLLFPVTTATAQAEPGAAAAGMCGHVQNRAALDLIALPGDGTFSVASLPNGPDGLTCVWKAWKTGAPEGSDPNATLMIQLYHFASVAGAHRKLTDYVIPPHAPQLVRTHDPDDEVIHVMPSMQVAHHGVEVAVAMAHAPRSVWSLPDWNAKFEALTLIASGAWLKGTPRPPPVSNAAERPATPAEPPAPAVSQPDTTPRAELAAASHAWQPPERPLRRDSAPLLTLVRLMWLAAHHGFDLVPASILASILIGFISYRLRSSLVLCLVPVVFGAAIVNLVMGADWADGLIYRHGIPAQATITGSFPTNIIYNNQDVVGFHVLIRPADGSVMETSFRTDDFNVYPPRNRTRYPDTGDVFTVRYLPGHPDAFVIIRNDDSPWATRLRCEGLAVEADQADHKVKFAPGNMAFRRVAQAAQAALQASGCQVDDSSN
jgi:hypothetical protein